MNNKIIPYVNFLEEHSPSPFASYILGLEFWKVSKSEVKGAYEWTKNFKLYSDIADEQLPDGSWGSYYSADAIQSKNRKYKTTSRAYMRILDLALPEYDEMTSRILQLYRDNLSGKTPIKERCSPNNTVQPELVRRHVIHELSEYEPNHPDAVLLREKLAKQLEFSCSGGEFDLERWRLSDTNPMIADFSLERLYMLSQSGCISEKLQRCFLDYMMNRKYYGVAAPAEPMLPSDNMFHFWLLSLEKLKNFSLFDEYSEKLITPHLLMLCERLTSPEKTDIFINRYHSQYGQYSESYRKYEYKRNDLLLRILRILNSVSE